MKKKTIKPGTMLNFKGFLILSAFAIWVYVMMNIKEIYGSAKDTLLYYGGNTFFIIMVVYILIILLEFFLDIGDGK